MKKTRADKSRVSAALREMRTRQGRSQEGMARELYVSLQTMTLWETKRPPGGIILARLADFAEENGYADLQQVFESELEKLSPAVGTEIKRERERWAGIYDSLDSIRHLVARSESEWASMIDRECDRLFQKLQEAQARAWRNQR
jgi:DNA-binding XRE family transcriptional regulator